MYSKSMVVALCPKTYIGRRGAETAMVGRHRAELNIIGRMILHNPKLCLVRISSQATFPPLTKRQLSDPTS